MREIFKYERRYYYPHMKPKDQEIWERFVDKYPDAYKQVQYDFSIGDAPAFSTIVDEVNGTHMNELYKLKIDVIGDNGTMLDIIELKPNATASTIGQVEGYKVLFIRDEKPTKKVGLVIITDKENLNMRYLCEQKGVKLFIV